MDVFHVMFGNFRSASNLVVIDYKLSISDCNDHVLVMCFSAVAYFVISYHKDFLTVRAVNLLNYLRSFWFSKEVVKQELKI